MDAADTDSSASITTSLVPPAELGTRLVPPATVTLRLSRSLLEALRDAAAMLALARRLYERTDSSTARARSLARSYAATSAAVR